MQYPKTNSCVTRWLMSNLLNKNITMIWHIIIAEHVHVYANIAIIRANIIDKHKKYMTTGTVENL